MVLHPGSTSKLLTHGKGYSVAHDLKISYHIGMRLLKFHPLPPHSLPLMSDLHHWHRESTPGKFTPMVSDVPGAGITISALLSVFQHVSNSMRKRAAGREEISDDHYLKTSCWGLCRRDLVHHFKHISAFSMPNVLLNLIKHSVKNFPPPKWTVGVLNTYLRELVQFLGLVGLQAQPVTYIFVKRRRSFF